MEFNKAYNRQEFVSFLRNNFLPEDFVPLVEDVPLATATKYTTTATKLGTCDSLDLVVYEVRHTSRHDARVALSKEAFRLLADEMQERALVAFVPEDNAANYRFSFIEISFGLKDETHIMRTYSNPHRYSFLLGEGIAYYTPNKYLNEKGRVVDDDDLRARFSVETLTQDFYRELSDWYAWAIKIIRFPNDIKNEKDDDKYNHESAIRLITRLIFVWFLKQRHLIPDEFFDQEYIANNLIENFCPHQKDGLFGFKSHESVYYKAILQNLFFAMLNSPITKEGSTKPTERRFRNGRGDYDNNKLMRYERYFLNPQLFVDLANSTVPFLNGGLFDCLDDKDKGIYYDGFSDRKEVGSKLIFPDYLFFGEEAGKNIDLSDFYGDKRKKRVSARGIIDILKRYNFTVEENTPFDKEVSLDPELLGKVFENLLAAYNPETQSTARKQTGSFYTPREIVQYMVDESLVAHVKRIVGEDIEPEFRRLLQYTDDPVDLSPEQRKSIMQSLYECRILDPACGSGAFPMGMLQQMVHILGRIDPENVEWKKMMMDMAVGETTEAFQADSKEERQELLADIERSFDENINRPDYARKLYLIEHCIYGVDIQPIAIQISKLRFFISLVVDQRTNNDPADNFGIRPLPNLEAKFVAANTLIGLAKKDATLFDTDAIKEKEQALKLAKHKIFSAKTIRTKRKYRQLVKDLRHELANMMEKTGAVGCEEARQLASWDMFDQNASSSFFDPQWMFDVKEGFDIVIANPPYVLLQNSDISIETQNNLKETYCVAQYKVDLYHLFIERGGKLLDKNGFLCYITSSTFLTNTYTEKLRQFMLDGFSVSFIVNIEDSVFEACVNTCIIGMARDRSASNELVYYKGVLKPNFIASELSICPQIEYLHANLCIIQPMGNYDDNLIMSKIEDNSAPLKNYALVKFGMQLRNRKIYPTDVITNPDSEELTPFHRKCLTGKDIMECYSVYNNRYCYFNREAKCGGCWDESVQNAKVKILIRQVGAIPVCGIDVNGYAVLNSAFMVIAHSINHYALLGLLNSKVLKYYWSKKFEDKRKAFPKIKGSYIELLPIIKINDDYFNSLVKKIVSMRKEGDNCVKEINEMNLMVYKLYNLTYDEVKVVDPETTITEEEYAKGE